MVTYDTSYTSIEQSDMPNVLFDFIVENMVIALGLVAVIILLCLFYYVRGKS